jgi:phosphoserine phosphatase
MPCEPHVAVLIVAPASRALTAEAVSRAATLLSDAGMPQWLATGEAAEITFVCDPADRASTAARIRRALAPWPIDAAVVPAAGRRKRLLVADMDSTIIAEECIDELAEIVGLRQEISAITERAMRGEIDFVQSITERVRLLQGLPEAALMEVVRTRITLNPGARTLTGTMRRFGARTAIISGGFSYFTGHVRQLAGFDEDHCNRLEIAGGRLTGRLVPPILDHDAKRRTLDAVSARMSLDPAETLAVGDGANDVDMIRAAGLGVAFRAKPVLREAAGAEIEHGDLTSLLYLQGYRASEFTV